MKKFYLLITILLTSTICYSDEQPTVVDTSITKYSDTEIQITKTWSTTTKHLSLKSLYTTKAVYEKQIVDLQDKINETQNNILAFSGVEAFKDSEQKSKDDQDIYIKQIAQIQKQKDSLDEMINKAIELGVIKGDL